VVAGVKTLKRNLYGKKATIVAAGCWSGSLMHELLKDCNIPLDVPVKPRKGHLLVVENFDSFHLNHGIMEAGYSNHQSASVSGLDVDERMLSISMTATMDTSGNLVLGNFINLCPLKSMFFLLCVLNIFISHTQYISYLHLAISNFREQP
jgi:glycine/D-amino acid oxidase-like deaminating enzyme